MRAILSRAVGKVAHALVCLVSVSDVEGKKVVLEGAHRYTCDIEREITRQHDISTIQLLASTLERWVKLSQ